MRENYKNFKGKFYVGQKVQVDFSEYVYIPKSRITTNGVGVITKILGKFLRSPEFTEIIYTVRFDEGKFCGYNTFCTRGERIKKYRKANNERDI